VSGVHRLAYAAAHVVMRAGYEDVEHSLERPGPPEEIARWIDWDATRALRVRLGALGFGVAEAMDTAQRFFLGWESARRLIRETGALGLARGFCAGAGTDHLEQVGGPEDLATGVAFQCAEIQAAGGIPVLLPMPWLAQRRASEDEYVATYAAILERVEGPVFVHWLGAMFLPVLEGYFPGDSFSRVMALDPEKVRGAKLSLLDPELEVRLRRELLERDQLLLTGDDFHFARLILGGDGNRVPPVERWTEVAGQRVALGDFSHALLGILDAIAQPAAQALERLEAADAAGYLERMLPCEALSRHLFEPPTQHYKAGLAWLAWRAGLQANALLVNHEERARDDAHRARAEALAWQAGVLADFPGETLA
jgi:hypothetical protein